MPVRVLHGRPASRPGLASISADIVRRAHRHWSRSVTTSQHQSQCAGRLRTDLRLAIWQGPTTHVTYCRAPDYGPPGSSSARQRSAHEVEGARDKYRTIEYLPSTGCMAETLQVEGAAAALTASRSRATCRAPWPCGTPRARPGRC